MLGSILACVTSAASPELHLLYHAPARTLCSYHGDNFERPDISPRAQVLQCRGDIDQVVHNGAVNVSEKFACPTYQTIAPTNE